MWDVFTQVGNNVGTGFELAVMIVAVSGGTIFYAKGFQIGTLVNLIIFSGIFIWFFQEGLNWSLPLIVLLMIVVILALSLFPIYKTDANQFV